jgi:MFS family permease
MNSKNKINFFLYCIFFFNGCFYASNQLLVNHILQAYQGNDAQMAMMVGALYLGPMLMVLFFGAFSDRYGRKISSALGLSVAALGALIIAAVPRIELIIFGFLLYGIGSGGVESVMFAITSDINEEKAGQHLILNQGIFSVGAMFAPLLLSKMLTNVQYKSVYALITVLCLAAISTLCKLPLKKEMKELKRTDDVKIGTMLRNKYLLFFMLSIIVSTGSESAFTYWAGIFFESINAGVLGAIALSTYWFASIFGRLAGSKVKKLESLVAPCFVLASFGTAIFTFALNPYLKLLGMLFVGVAFAPVYPALGYQSSRLFPENTGIAFAIITFSSNLGGVITQPVISRISENSKIHLIYVVIMVLCGMIAIGTIISNYYLKKRD